MGYALPAAIGACVALGKKRVICLEGDGSIQLNIQELQTIAHYRLPIEIIVLSNGGYSSIRQTQDRYFKGHHVGCNPQSGVSFPNIAELAKIYGVKLTVADIGDFNFNPKFSSLREVYKYEW
jgi:acetolactate synthase-1/2/3 large subunit